MVAIRLLTSIAGGPVEGAVGDVVEVDARTAAVWADGIRAERVAGRTPVDEERTAGPAGEQETAEPVGETATAVPPGERATRPPRGERATKR